MTDKHRLEGAVDRHATEIAVGDGWMDGAAAANRDEYSIERHGRLVSASRPVAALPVERFLHAAAGQERFFWRDGRQGIAFAGAGVAAHLMGYGHRRFAAIQRQAGRLFAFAETGPTSRYRLAPRSELALPRLFGGFAFNQDFVPDMVWTGFHPGHFILPHYQLVTQHGHTWLTINALLPPQENASSILPLLEEALAARAQQFSSTENSDEAAAARSPSPGMHGQPAGLDIDYPLPYSQWQQLLENALQTFATTPLQKVVLSRIAQLRAQQPINILQALNHLTANYPDCFSFLFEPQPGHAFLGATPELLARVQGAELETMALAGSIQRGTTAAEDTELAAALLASTKDRHEHALVVDALRNILQPLSNRLTIAAEPTLLTLSNIHHLYSPVYARLNEEGGVLPLLEALHPTPAMGGTPRQLGLNFIQSNEPTLRGWYAAPVGWIDSGMDGAFAVAIRSAIVQRERAWAYAGAGIVPDSVPQKEWEETAWKFQPIINAVMGSQPE